MEDEFLYQKIIEDMFSRKLKSQNFKIDMVGEPNRNILRSILKEGELINQACLTVVTVVQKKKQ